MNHQLIYGSTNSINPINTSINVSLMNDKIFKSKNKESFNLLFFLSLLWVDRPM